MRNNSPYFTTARFDSTCAESGAAIKRGETIAYYPRERKAYKENSKAAENVRALQFSQAWSMADSNY